MASELQGLKDALAFSVSLIASEHFVSAGMSSPWSVAKFAKTDKDAEQVWKLYREAAYASVATSAVVGLLLHDWEAFWWGMAGATAVMVLIASEYKRALEGTL